MFTRLSNSSKIRLQRPHLYEKQKLLTRLKNAPSAATFDDIRSLLFEEGFRLDRVTGSHHIISKDDITFVIPVHATRVKSVYVKRVIKLVEATKEKADDN